MDYKEKAEILCQNFSIYGIGNFDLNLEEIAQILELIETKTQKKCLEINLQELYERLSSQRLG